MSKTKRFHGNEFDFVAKHCRTFNKATVEEDRKKRSKRESDRKMKHKNKYSQC